MFYKASLILFNDFTLRKLFLILSFIFGSASLIIFINNNIRNLLIIVYLVVLSIFIWPYFQEYIDPILIILILLFSTKKILINKLKSILIALYFLFFLIISSIYYYTWYNYFYPYKSNLKILIGWSNSIVSIFASISEIIPLKYGSGSSILFNWWIIFLSNIPDPLIFQLNLLRKYDNFINILI